MTAGGNAIDLQDLRFDWTAGRPVLDIPRFTLARGERLLLRGPSGAGKSTLLALICGLLVPDRGRLRVLDRDLPELSAAGRDRLRAERMGVIFQTFNLLPYYSVRDNVLLPLSFSSARLARLEGADPGREAERLLTRLGLDDPALWKRPARALSIGQQQRVAAARALIGRPELVIADEPTSALDEQARDAFLDLLFAEVERSGPALLFVSHERAIAHHFPAIVELGEINRAGAAALA